MDGTGYPWEGASRIENGEVQVRVGAVETDGCSRKRGNGGCLQDVSGNRGLRGSPIDSLRMWRWWCSASDGGGQNGSMKWTDHHYRWFRQEARGCASEEVRSSYFASGRSEALKWVIKLGTEDLSGGCRVC